MLPAAILAGGLGTRLYPLTERMPKALVEINGEPFLAHQLRLLRARGIERVVLCIGQHGDRIREYAGDGARFGLDIDYSPDGRTLLGTAGAGCSTQATVSVTDGTNSVTLTTANGTAIYDSGAVTQNFAAAANLDVKIVTPASGCSTAPQNGNVTAQFRMQ